MQILKKMSKKDNTKLNSSLKIFIFGSIAAASAKTVIGPLDRAKIIIQSK